MKTTVLVFHPSIENSRVNKTLAKEAENNNLEVRYIYSLYPDGDIDVETEQKVLEEASRIVFQFPMYWYSAPALLRTWQDKVLQYGWAYGSKAQALKGKEIMIAVSTGAEKDKYTKEVFGYSTKEILAPFHAMSNMIGMKYVEPFVVNGALNITDAEIKRASSEYVERLIK